MAVWAGKPLTTMHYLTIHISFILSQDRKEPEVCSLFSHISTLQSTVIIPYRTNHFCKRLVFQNSFIFRWQHWEIGPVGNIEVVLGLSTTTVGLANIYFSKIRPGFGSAPVLSILRFRELDYLLNFLSPVICSADDESPRFPYGLPGLVDLTQPPCFRGYCVVVFKDTVLRLMILRPIGLHLPTRFHDLRIHRCT